MYQELVRAHEQELSIASLKIERRMEWAQISRIERLERALKSARAKLQLLPHLSAEAN